MMRSDYSERKILIVDDEDDIREFLRWEFEDRNAVVIDAKNIEDGFQKFSDTEPDFTLVDIRMPGGSGIDLLKSCKRKNIELPVAVMTGFTEISRPKIYAAGACDIFKKPLDYSLLFPRIDLEIRPASQRFFDLDKINCQSSIELNKAFDKEFSSKHVKFGLGGTTHVFPYDFFDGRENKYYKINFLENEWLIVRLCWQMKLEDGQIQYGFEWKSGSRAVIEFFFNRQQKIKTLSYLQI